MTQVRMEAAGGGGAGVVGRWGCEGPLFIALPASCCFSCHVPPVPLVVTSWQPRPAAAPPTPRATGRRWWWRRCAGRWCARAARTPVALAHGGARAGRGGAAAGRRRRRRCAVGTRREDSLSPSSLAPPSRGVMQLSRCSLSCPPARCAGDGQRLGQSRRSGKARGSPPPPPVVGLPPSRVVSGCPPSPPRLRQNPKVCSRPDGPAACRPTQSSAASNPPRTGTK